MKYWIFIFLFYFSQQLSAQLLYDNSTQKIIQQTIDKIYNYEFAEAETLSKQIPSRYANHPVLPLLKALRLQWEYLPVKDHKNIIGPYFALLQECLKKAEILEKDPKTQAEAAFFSMSGHGYIALVHNYNDEKMKAVLEAKKAYNYVMRGFELMDKNPEFYMSSGLYNYYVEEYPKEHPFVKPILLFFRDGNRDLGLKQMDVAIQRGIFTRTEGAYYLARINLKHEKKFDVAASYLDNLVAEYPQNSIFLMKYTESLLLGNKFEKAQPFLERLKKYSSKIFELASNTFEGILFEKSKKNDIEAEKKYQEAIKIPSDDEFTKDYHAFSYCGLARIALRKGNKQAAKVFYKKAENLSEYAHIQDEIRAALK